MRSRQNRLGDFFPYVLNLVGSVTWHVMFVGGDWYLVELVEVHESWVRHHDFQKKKIAYYIY